MLAEAVCGLLAEDDRLRVFAAVVLGARSPAEVATGSGLPPRDVLRALTRLEQGGLISTVDGHLVARGGEIKEAARESRPAPGVEDPLDPDRQKAQVLRTFIREGRLVQIPMPRGKRRIVLEHLAAAFEPGVKYPEKEVNATLRAWHDDYAALRRYLVDEGLMAREDGLYWRTGGPVDVATGG